MTTKSTVKELEEFLGKEGNLFFDLRENKGINDSSLNELMEILDRLALEYKDVTLIEKRLAFLLSDIVPGLLVYLGSYTGDQAGRIHEAADATTAKIDEILS